MDFLNRSIIIAPMDPPSSTPLQNSNEREQERASSPSLLTLTPLNDTYDPLYDGTFDYAENAAIRNDDESAARVDQDKTCPPNTETIGASLAEEESPPPPIIDETANYTLATAGDNSKNIKDADEELTTTVLPRRATVHLPFLVPKAANPQPPNSANNLFDFHPPPINNQTTFQYVPPAPNTQHSNGASNMPSLASVATGRDRMLLHDLSKQISRSLASEPVFIDVENESSAAAAASGFRPAAVEDEVRKSLQNEFTRAEPTLKKVYEAVQNDENITDPTIMENVRKDFCSFMFTNSLSAGDRNHTGGDSSNELKTRYNEIGKMFEKINLGGGSSIAAIIDSIITSMVGDNIPVKDMNIMTIIALITNYVYATIFEKIGAEPEAEDLTVLNKITSMLFYELLNDRVKSILNTADCDTGQKTTRIYLLVVACVPLLIKIAKTCKSRPKPYPPVAANFPPTAPQIQQQQRPLIQQQQQQQSEKSPYYNAPDRYDGLYGQPIHSAPRSKMRFQPYRNDLPSHPGMFYATRITNQGQNVTTAKMIPPSF